MGTDPSIASLLAPLGGDFGSTSASELALVGAACGAVGVWVVYFGRAFLAESFGHALLPGLVVAAALGSSLVVGAIVGVIVAYGVLLLAQRAPRTSDSSATAVGVTLLVAIGALIASQGTGSARFESLLFGDPLAATWRDVAVAGAFALIVGLFLSGFHDRFAALAFDPQSARTIGVNVGLTGALLIGVLAVAIATAATVAGSRLALALLTGPALGVIPLRMRLGATLLAASVVGALTGVVGIYISYYANWPASASVALAACAFAASGAAGGAWLAGRRPSVRAAAQAI